MLKTKYERMTKLEKKELEKKYKETEKGKLMMERLLRVKIIGVIGIVYAGYFLIKEGLVWKNILLYGPLLVISLIFIVTSKKLKKKVLNQLAIKTK